MMWDSIKTSDCRTEELPPFLSYLELSVRLCHSNGVFHHEPQVFVILTFRIHTSIARLAWANRRFRKGGDGLRSCIFAGTTDV